MWWSELDAQARALTSLAPGIHATARIHASATLEGAVRIGAGTVVCAGAHLVGPVEVGCDALIGNGALVRGPVRIGDATRIGVATEIKLARIGAHVRIGPHCVVADSVVDDDAYLGAMVRTSNHRLDGRTVEAIVDGARIDTGLSKLGCHIGARASLGVQVIVLPGRTVAADALFGPRITIERNLPAGRYRLAQAIETF